MQTSPPRGPLSEGEGETPLPFGEGPGVGFQLRNSYEIRKNYHDHLIKIGTKLMKSAKRKVMRDFIFETWRKYEFA
ncbi:MAG: hypothetical protein BWK80_22470 [Desulfobacteraceae bacterium IS3]|nr:MAG: hypothetical protein BWK80_22470 [Desulfobacteraceae bacterium IS3]